MLNLSNRWSWRRKQEPSRVFAGVKFSGVLCGRATWKDGIPVYQKNGMEAFRLWLKEQGVRNLSRVNQALRAATPWYSIYGVESAA